MLPRALLLVLALSGCKDDEPEHSDESPPDSEYPCDDPWTWYTDEDGDGWGRSGTGVRACEQPPGTSNQDGDCDDHTDFVHPGAEDIPRNGWDEDCSGVDTCGVGETFEGDRTFTERASADMAAFCADWDGVGGDLEITATNVPNLFSLTCICEVGGALRVHANAELETTDGLDVLSVVGGDVFLAANPRLANLEGLHHLVDVGGSLRLEDNAALVDPSALLGLSRIGGDLVIRGNTALGEAAATALAEALRPVVAGAVVVEDNGG